MVHFLTVRRHYMDRRSSDFHVSNLVQGIRKYYVRRADGQPVRLKNKVKVDVDGNLDVDGNIRCSQITASKRNDGANGLTVTSEGFVGIGNTNPDVLYMLLVTQNL